MCPSWMTPPSMRGSGATGEGLAGLLALLPDSRLTWGQGPPEMPASTWQGGHLAPPSQKFAHDPTSSGTVAQCQPRLCGYVCRPPRPGRDNQKMQLCLAELPRALLSRCLGYAGPDLEAGASLGT